MTITYATTLAKHDVTIPDHLIADAEVPALTGPQRQGDVGIFPRARAGKAELADAITLEVGGKGLAVVAGESSTGGNAHILDAYEGPIFWMPATKVADTSVTLGVVHVPKGSVAVVTHTDEHGSNAIAAGTYIIHGKREQADLIRRVAD